MGSLLRIEFVSPVCPRALTTMWLESERHAVMGILVHPATGEDDPVSHCLSPRSPAFVSWILASAEVLA